MELAKKLKMHLENKNLTYQQLGQTIGVAASTLHAWVNDAEVSLNKKNIDSLRKFMRISGYSTLDELLLGKDNFSNTDRELIVALKNFISDCQSENSEKIP